MNAELQTQLATMITGLNESAGAAKEFLIEETPLVLQQLVTFYAVYTWMLCSIGGLFLIASAIFLWKTVHSKKNFLHDNSQQTPTSRFGLATTSALSFLISLTYLGNLKEAIMLTIAPKVWLIEYAADLVNKIN